MSSLNKESDSRLTPENSALLLVDHQTGLCSGVANHSQPEFLNSVLALAHIGKVFGLPTIISTSFSQGPNGPLISEVGEMFPDTPIVHRPGEINAWDNPDFVAAVKATNRKNLIIAGVSTEVCVAFLALSVVKEGYGAYAVIDASGTWNALVTDDAVSKKTASDLLESVGFSSADLGTLSVGGQLQQAGAPLSAINLIRMSQT